jgi:hypothetical protein
MIKNIRWLPLFLFSIAVFGDTIKPNGCKGPVLCNSFLIYDGYGWHFELGLLVEKMVISNLDVYYIQQIFQGTPTVSNPNRTDSIKNVSFPVSVGLKLGAGKYFLHDDWMFNLSFEWLNSVGSCSDDLSNHGGRAIVPIANTVWAGLEDPLDAYGLQKADISLNTNYFLLDGYVSRGSYISGHFTYEPYGGIKAAWIYYKMRESYWDSIPSTETSTKIAPYETLKNLLYTDYWGVGPMIGMKGDYYYCFGWSFFTSCNFAILYGGTNITNREGVVSNTSTPPNYLLKDSFNNFCPTLRNIIGLQFDKDSYCEKRHYNLRFGFDTRYYFNQYPAVEQNAYKLIYEDPGASVGLSGYPNIVENNSFAMIGFLLEGGIDF